MMIGPVSYIENLKDAEYLELINERDNLIQYIKNYEKKDMAGDHSGSEWSIHPQPDVRYQMYLEYLAELCKYMSEKYNQEYVDSDRTLKEDAEKRSHAKKH